MFKTPIKDLLVPAGEPDGMLICMYFCLYKAGPLNCLVFLVA